MLIIKKSEKRKNRKNKRLISYIAEHNLSIQKYTSKVDKYNKRVGIALLNHSKFSHKRTNK